MSANINPNVAPRLITVPATDGTEITMQQLVTQVRDWEDEPSNLAFPYVMKASGKEDLGGGVVVGITTQLQNGKLAFEQRGTSISSGTVTTIDATGNKLIDSGATFISDGVIEGASIINFTDQSVGTVLSVDSETQITLLTALEDGTDNQWDSSDIYKIWNIIQCEASGGNLTAVDTLGVTIDSIFPTFGTQIVRTSSSSATLQELTAIQYSSFNGGVTVDIANISGRATSGISFPTGTPEQPVNNLSDLNLIALERGLNSIYIIGNLTLDNTADWTRYQFTGESALKTMITVQSIANVINCEFYECVLTGDLDGASQVERSVLSNLSIIDGYIFNCSLASGTTITLGTSDINHILQSFSGQPGVTSPIIDCNETGVLSLRDYVGGAKAINYTGSSSHSIDLSSGQFILDSATIIGGTWVVRGVGKLVDENGTVIPTGTWNTTVTIINETNSYLLSIKTLTSQEISDIADAVDLVIDDATAIANAVWDKTICP